MSISFQKFCLVLNQSRLQQAADVWQFFLKKSYIYTNSTRQLQGFPMVSFSSLVQNSLIAFQMVQKQKHTHKSVGRTPGQWSTAHKNHLFALFTEQRKRGLLPQYLQCTFSCLCCQPLPVNIHSPLPHLCGPKTSCRLWLHLCVPTLPD